MTTNSPVNADFISRLQLQDPHDLEAIHGGDINLAYSLYSGNQHFFLKVQPNHPASFFDTEVAGLRAIGQVVPTPKVMAQGQVLGHAYLLLSWVPAGNGSQTNLGQTLAQLHQATNDRFGFDQSNLDDFIPKDNSWQDSWGEFFIKQRLEPLMAQAQKKSFWLTQRGQHFDELKKTIRADAHVQSVKPSLLHGDFWAGNFMFNKQGQSVLIDPNAFYGDREYDLGISLVFAGFNPTFYQSYQEALPLDEGWQVRMKWYEFYYILMHFVRFGDIYAPRLDALLTSF